MIPNTTQDQPNGIKSEARDTEQAIDTPPILADSSENIPSMMDVPAANAFSEGPKNYRTMGRRDMTIVLITNQVGLGVLSIPAVMKTLGIVPGVIAIIGIGMLATYTAYVLLQFYRKYPHVLNFVDMARIVGGRPMEWFVAFTVIAKLMFTCAAAVIALSVAFNTLSNQAVCTVVWIALGTICSWILCLPRTLKFVAYAGIPCTISILAAVFIVIIALGVDHPQGVKTDTFDKKIELIGNPSFRDGLNACLQLIYAFSGNVGYVSYMAEMKNPSKDYVPSILALQIFAIPLYLIVALSIYCMAGQYTSSTALGSAPQIPAMVAYGVALPAILATGMVFGHTAVKYLYVEFMRALKSTDQMTGNSVKSWTVWIGSAMGFWIATFILSNAVPVFSSVLSISSAWCIAWFTYGLPAVFWFYLNWDRKFSSYSKIALSILNLLIFIQAAFMNVAGLWASISDLLDVFKRGEGGLRSPFSCADNSIF